MRNKKAKQLRRLTGLDLGRGSVDKDAGATITTTKTIAQIRPDGNHTTRVVDVLEARTSEERYMYRQLKKVYTGKIEEPELRLTLIQDLNKLPKKQHKQVVSEDSGNDQEE